MQNPIKHLRFLLTVLLTMLSMGAWAQLADITQPGDPIVGSSNNNPGSEAVANVIDNQPTKYLNFDRLNTGFTVTPRVGLSVVQCLTLTSANDAPERDPATYTLEGSYNGSNFTAIASGPVPAFTNRFHKVVVQFDNDTPYIAYRLIFPTVTGPGGNSMQIFALEFLGFFGRSDVTPRIAQIELTSAARAAGRLAYQLDRSEESFADLQGSLPQKIVRFAGNKVMGLEVTLTRFAERAYIRPAEIEGGVVDTLRGIKPKSAA